MGWPPHPSCSAPDNIILYLLSTTYHLATNIQHSNLVRGTRGAVRDHVGGLLSGGVVWSGVVEMLVVES